MNRVFVLREASHLRQLIRFIGANWEACADSGHPLEAVVSEHKARRSSAQNSLYWSVLSEIADGAWIQGRQYDRDAWHHYYANLFLPKRDIPGGVLHPVSTTTLDVAEFSRYIDQIHAHATTELGVQFGVAA